MAGEDLVEKEVGLVQAGRPAAAAGLSELGRATFACHGRAIVLSPKPNSLAAEAAAEPFSGVPAP